MALCGKRRAAADSRRLQAAWGGGAFIKSESPVLISVKKPEKEKADGREGRREKNAENRHRRSCGKSHEAGSSRSIEPEPASRTPSSSVASRSTPGGRLGHYANEAARKALAKTLGSLMPAGGEASEAKASDAKTEGKEKANGKDKADTKDEKGGAKTADDKSGDKTGAKSDDAKGSDSKAKDGKSESSVNGASDSKEEPTVTRLELAQSLNCAWQRGHELLAPDRPAARPLDACAFLGANSSSGSSRSIGNCEPATFRTRIWTS